MQALRRLWSGERQPVMPSPGGKTITDLPNELLHRILVLLDLEDIMAARFVCKTLGMVGAEHLMDTIRLFCARPSFEEMVAASKHPLIGPRIRKLEYCAAKAPLDVQVDHTRNNLTAPREHQAGQQRNVLDSAFEVEALAQMMGHCRKLDTIRLGYSFYHFEVVRLHALRSMPAWPSTALHDSNPLRAGAHDLAVLSTTLERTGTKLRRLTAFQLGCSTFQQSSREREVLRRGLKHLHHLNLGFSIDTNHSEYMPEGEDGEIDEYAERCFADSKVVDILTGMTELKTLRVQCPMVEDVFDDYNSLVANLESFVGQHTWPKLRDVHLSGLVTSSETLVQFLLRHKDRLRSLFLNDITLSDHDWTHVLEAIAGQFPRLARFELFGSFKVLFDPNGPETETQFRFLDLDTDTMNEVQDSKVRDAIVQYIMEGGEIPDYESLAQAEDDLWNSGEEGMMTIGRRTDEENDGGYDSDGSHISLEFDEGELAGM